MPLWYELSISFSLPRLLELGHTITVTEEIYVKTINEYGQPATIASFSSFYASVILSAFIDFTAQAFFAYRIKKFSGKWIAAGICGFAAFVRLVMIVMGGVLGSVATDVVQFQAKWGWLVTSMLALGAAIDVTVAVSLCFYLRQHRNSPFTRLVDIAYPQTFLMLPSYMYPVQYSSSTN